MLFTKGQTGNVWFIFFVFTFQAVIITLLGFLGQEQLNANHGCLTSDCVSGSYTQETINNTLTTDFSVAKTTFFQGVGFSVSSLGWANTIIFLPMGIGLLFVILALIRGGE